MTSSSDLLKKRREREKLIEARKRLTDQKKKNVNEKDSF